VSLELFSGITRLGSIGSGHAWLDHTWLGHTWFDALLPTLFHLVLALFLLTLGLHQAGRLVRVLSHIAYPMIVAGAMGGHFLLQHLGAGLPAATLLPVLMAALLITALERRLPYRESWRPGRRGLVTDLVYMVLVQQLLPRVFAFLVAFAMLTFNPIANGVFSGLWPHHWAPALQALAMLLVVEFLRYWLHRIAHRWQPVWRLHAVHHSPDHLYWLNVGRFHPLEKGIQLAFDTLPFLVLGVDPAVLSLYFVFYAVHGMFQHCNADLRLGVLNWLVSGPELHRWHHSRCATESDRNFGNNLIVWDILFGTRFLPANAEVGELGLRNRRYPMGFVAQLRSPFIAGLDQRQPGDHP
jgi:sterol desaturase/sphingolipid hydroxylase (fatty acid hydroxylase superfamily)